VVITKIILLVFLLRHGVHVHYCSLFQPHTKQNFSRAFIHISLTHSKDCA